MRRQGVLVGLVLALASGVASGEVKFTEPPTAIFCASDVMAMETMDKTNGN